MADLKETLQLGDRIRKLKIKTLEYGKEIAVLEQRMADGREVLTLTDEELDNQYHKTQSMKRQDEIRTELHRRAAK